MKTVINFGIPKNARNVLNIWGNISFPTRTLLHGVSITNLADTKEGGGRTCWKGVRKLSESLYSYYYQRIIQSNTIVCSLQKQTCFYNSSLHVSTYRADSHTKNIQGRKWKFIFLKEIFPRFYALMASKAAQKFSKIARNYEYYNQLLLKYLFYYKTISCSKDI